MDNTWNCPMGGRSLLSGFDNGCQASGGGQQQAVVRVVGGELPGAVPIRTASLGLPAQPVNRQTSRPSNPSPDNSSPVDRYGRLKPLRQFFSAEEIEYLRDFDWVDVSCKIAFVRCRGREIIGDLEQRFLGMCEAKFDSRGWKKNCRDSRGIRKSGLTKAEMEVLDSLVILVKRRMVEH